MVRMIGLVAFFLPLLLGLVLAALFCGRANRASRKAMRSKEPFLVIAFKYLGIGFAALAGTGIVLAILFASATDTGNGHAEGHEFWQYVRFQILMLSVFFVPALLLSLVTGQQKRFGEDEI